MQQGWKHDLYVQQSIKESLKFPPNAPVQLHSSFCFDKHNVTSSRCIYAMFFVTAGALVNPAAFSRRPLLPLCAWQPLAAKCRCGKLSACTSLPDCKLANRDTGRPLTQGPSSELSLSPRAVEFARGVKKSTGEKLQCTITCPKIFLTWVSFYQAVHARLVWKFVVHQAEQACQEGGEEGSQTGVEDEVKYADLS